MYSIFENKLDLSEKVILVWILVAYFEKKIVAHHIFVGYKIKSVMVIASHQKGTEIWNWSYSLDWVFLRTSKSKYLCIELWVFIVIFNFLFILWNSLVQNCWLNITVITITLLITQISRMCIKRVLLCKHLFVNLGFGHTPVCRKCLV